MGLILDKNLLPKGKASPTDILISIYEESQRKELQSVASKLRQKNYSVEIYPSSPKLGKQIEYADKKGIPFVFFSEPGKQDVRLKNLATKEEKNFESVHSFIESLPLR